MFGICKSNDSPIIGILALPCQSTSTWCPPSVNKNAVSYLPSSYVKWIEGGGARVIPIFPDYSYSSLETLLKQVNAVLFTGGSASFESSNIWWQQLNNILKYLRETSSSNNAIPLWATCLGFQGLISATAGINLNSDHEAEDIALAINFINDASKSRIFSPEGMNTDYSQMVYDKLGSEKLVMNFHKYGVSPTTLTNNKNANGNFTILGTQNDDNGKPFVTLIESNDNLNLFWYGSQFHPEKPQYEFDLNKGDNNIVHNIDAIISNQYLAEFFVNEARIRNDHTMETNYYQERIIYNYNAVVIDNGQSTYQEVYVFGPAPSS